MKEEEKKPISSTSDDKIIRFFSLVIIVAVVIADYLGYESKYSDYVVGVCATFYLLGRKGLIILFGKKIGYDAKELDDLLN